MDVFDVIRNLGQKENSINTTEFVSPVFNNTTVVTYIGGLVHRLEIPRMDPGWYLLRPENLKRAIIKRPADMVEISEYMKHLKKVRVVLLNKGKELYQALPLKNNSLGLDPSIPVPVYLPSDYTETFEMAICGFDGANLWYYVRELINDPTKAEYLREQLEKNVSPDRIRYTGLILEEKMAYALLYALEEKKKELTVEGSLKKDIEHGGGQYVKFHERKDHFSVTYKVDGQQYTSYVAKDRAHHVLTAGICLSGGDQTFDLASLVSVLREGQKQKLIHRFGNTRA